MAVPVILADQLAALAIRGVPNKEFALVGNLGALLIPLLATVLLVLAWRIKLPVYHAGCGLWVGGALNNWGEWLVKGSVEDFIPIGPTWGIWHVTNVADIAIALGGVLIIYVLLSRADVWLNR